MIRSVWCRYCKKIANTITQDGLEVCPRCGKRVDASSAGFGGSEIETQNA